MRAMGKLSETLALAQERARSLGLPYAGALTPREAWDVLQLAPGSKLVDAPASGKTTFLRSIANFASTQLDKRVVVIDT